MALKDNDEKQNEEDGYSENRVQLSWQYSFWQVSTLCF